MFSFLTSTRSVSLSITINATIDEVLKILHNPHALLSLSPLLSNISHNDSNSSLYTITDRLGFLGYFHITTSFQCTLINRDDGVETKVAAGGGTRIRGVFRVKPGDENGTSVVTEQATVEGLFFLMPYIIYTMTQAHIATLSTLANKAENTPSRFLSSPPTSRSKHLIHSYRSPKEPQVLETTVPGSPTSSSFSLIFAASLSVIALIFWTSAGYASTLVMIVGALLVFYRLNVASDPYGLFHLTLNHLPGQDPTIPPQTEWLNMGFWKDTDIFPQACRALALKLIQAARCKRGDRVLDVGHGTGESLLLLLSDPLIRPSALTGITSLPNHHHRARNRVKQFQKSSEEPAIEVSLHACDAIYHPTAIDHPLDPARTQLFDVILALDCAYHFNTRNTFLRQAFEKLTPGGRIGLADICFDSSMSSRGWLVASLIRVIPTYNLTSTKDYVSNMKAVGYLDVELGDITDDVFPGFIPFLKGRGWGWWVFGTMLQWYVDAGARFVIVRGSRAL